MAGRLFIHATNVHQGGGRSLLMAILHMLPAGIQSILFLDDRMALSEAMPQEAKVKRVVPSIWGRFVAERELARQVAAGDVVLCFGNLPPIFKLSGHVVVFVQNRYLVDHVPLSGFPFKARLRVTVERLWLSFMVKNVDEFIVQTPSMKNLLEVRTGGIPVSISPFVKDHDGFVRKERSPEVYKEKDFDFLYVASGETHKNHRQLIEAWCLLANQGLFPSLTLTLNRAHFAGLCSWIEQKVEQFRLNVKNAGNVPHDQIKRLYARAGALIYPSTFESFGLPLIEAKQAGLPILASELDYVRDVVDPEQTFNPESAISIAKAVKRFLRVEEQQLSLQDAKSFMTRILEHVQ